MSITIDTAAGAVTAEEMFDGFRKGIDAGAGPAIVKRYLIPWAKSDAFINAVMGITISQGGITGTIFRTSPHRCPESLNLWALSCDVEPEGTPVINNGRPTWSHAVATVLYGVQPWGQLNNDNTADPYNLNTPDGQSYPFCSFRFSGGSEILSVPGTAYKFSSGPGAGSRRVEDSRVGIRVGVATIQASVHFVPFLPFLKIVQLRGKVNLETFLGCDPEQILFDEVNSDETINTDGTRTQTLEYTFRYRQPGWNVAMDYQDGNVFHSVSADGTVGGTLPYELADLRGLFFGCNLS